MPVVPAYEIPRFEVDGVCIWGLATAARGAVEVMLWRNRIEAGSAFPAAKRDHEQVVAVLSGSGLLRERELALPFSTGDVLIVPAGALCQIVPAEEGPPFECVMAMPLATRHFTSRGDPMRLPWTD